LERFCVLLQYGSVTAGGLLVGVGNDLGGGGWYRYCSGCSVGPTVLVIRGMGIPPMGGGFAIAVLALPA